jgi:hypothetical protein
MARTSDNTLVPALGVYAQAGAPTFSADLTGTNADMAEIVAAEVATAADLPTSDNWVGRRIWVDSIAENRWWDGSTWSRALTGVPYATATGVAAFSGLTQNVVKTIAVTFPSGLFSVAPVVAVSVQTGAPLVAAAATDSPTTAGFTLYAQRSDATTSLNVRWIAVQQ